VADILLVVSEGPGAGAHHPIDDTLVLGRDETADVRLRDRTVSRRHAALRAEGETCVIQDLGSRNGTYVNSERVESPRRVRIGETIQVGRTVLELQEIAGETEPFPPPVTPTEAHPAPDSGGES
jgi:pSer/pThr/pTyr-binding forkhead associated (FHA) protein